jgi:hypothetical protein
MDYDHGIMDHAYQGSQTMPGCSGEAGIRLNTLIPDEIYANLMLGNRMDGMQINTGWTALRYPPAEGPAVSIPPLHSIRSMPIKAFHFVLLPLSQTVLAPYRPAGSSSLDFRKYAVRIEVIGKHCPDDDPILIKEES